MAWATDYIEKLKRGETVDFRPSGYSMTGRIDHGQKVTVKPITDFDEMIVDDVVLCEMMDGAQYLHLVKDIDRDDKIAKIGNNKGRINGWTTFSRIYGKVMKVWPLVVVLLFIAGCDTRPPSQRSVEEQQTIQQTADQWQTDLASMAYKREVDKYHFLKANEAPRVELCVQTGLLSALAAESRDDQHYRAWRRLEKKFCR